jgi:hypothetical protein
MGLPRRGVDFEGGLVHGEVGFRDRPQGRRAGAGGDFEKGLLVVGMVEDGGGILADLDSVVSRTITTREGVTKPLNPFLLFFSKL